MSDLAKEAAKRIHGEPCPHPDGPDDGANDCRRCMEAIIDTALQAQAKEWEARLEDVRGQAQRHINGREQLIRQQVEAIAAQDRALASKDRAATALAEALRKIGGWSDMSKGHAVALWAAKTLAREALAAWAEHLKEQQG